MTIDPNQFVYESFTENHGEDYVGHAVAYTPEGQMVLEAKFNPTGVNDFELVFDAGSLSEEEIDRVDLKFGIDEVHETDRVVSDMSYLGAGHPDGAPTEQARAYTFDEDDYSFNVGLEDVGIERSSKLIVDGVYRSSEGVEERVAEYAQEVSGFDIIPFVEYMEEHNGVSPEKVDSSKEETWEDLIEECLEEAVQAVSVNQGK